MTPKVPCSMPEHRNQCAHRCYLCFEAVTERAERAEARVAGLTACIADLEQQIRASTQRTDGVVHEALKRIAELEGGIARGFALLEGKGAVLPVARYAELLEMALREIRDVYAAPPSVSGAHKPGCGCATCLPPRYDEVFHEGTAAMNEAIVDALVSGEGRARVPRPSEARPLQPASVKDDGTRMHYLKCWPFPFGDVLSGAKPFEYRKHDRDYWVGDVLVLEEWDPDAKKYTGRATSKVVTYFLPGGTFGVPEGYCVMGIAQWQRPNEPVLCDGGCGRPAWVDHRGEVSPTCGALPCIQVVQARILGGVPRSDEARSCACAHRFGHFSHCPMAGARTETAEPDLLKKALKYLNGWHQNKCDIGEPPYVYTEHDAEVQALVDLLRPASAPETGGEAT